MHVTRTKIVATLGPASWEEPMLAALFEAGVDVARINCSHTDADGIRRQVARVRRTAMKTGAQIAILLDLQGPKIRIGKVETPIVLGVGDVLTVVMDSRLADGRRVGTTYPEMAGDVKVGDVVLFADGTVGGVVSDVRMDQTPPEVDVTIDIPGTLSSFKGLNLPGVLMSVPCLTEKDLADLAVGLDVGVDYVALSFVQRASDVNALRDEMTRLGRVVPICAKIEKPQAVDNIEEIVATADAVMVARGDLGVEVSLERVPVYQKIIIEAGFQAGIPVITATQMLDSMERNPRPTRAETTDIANAILDGTDAVMLSGETSTGKYPVEAVRTMDRIAYEVEVSKFFRPTPPDRLPRTASSAGTAILRAAVTAASDPPRPVVVFTWTGHAAVTMSKARLAVPIYALTPNRTVMDRLALVWGVQAFEIPAVKTTDELVAAAEQVLLANGVPRGEEMVFVAGETPFKGATHFMKILTVGG